MTVSSVWRRGELGWPTSSQAVHFSNSTARPLLGEGKGIRKAAKWQEPAMAPNCSGNGPNAHPWHSGLCEPCVVLLLSVPLWGKGWGWGWQPGRLGLH